SPASLRKRLLGTQMTPPDLAVVPPTNAVFSRISTDRPARRITSPAHIEPAPLPTTTKSNCSSNPLIRLAPSSPRRKAIDRQHRAQCGAVQPSPERCGRSGADHGPRQIQHTREIVPRRRDRLAVAGEAVDGSRDLVIKGRHAGLDQPCGIGPAFVP